MYQVTTNFGSYRLALMPSSTDVMHYYHKARLAGLEIKDIKFEIVELPKPECQSISTILADVRH